MNEFKNKILITGASGGLGNAICSKFLHKNYTLILTASTEDKKNNLKKKYGEQHFYYNVNLSDKNNLEECMLKISNEHKDLSVIVNNAGITEDNLIFR